MITITELFALPPPPPPPPTTTTTTTTTTIVVVPGLALGLLTGGKQAVAYSGRLTLGSLTARQRAIIASE